MDNLSGGVREDRVARESYCGHGCCRGNFALLPHHPVSTPIMAFELPRTILNPSAEHESKGTRADSPFTVRAMVDAVTSPDILGLVMKHILDGRTRDGSKGDSQVPPR